MVKMARRRTCTLLNRRRILSPTNAGEQQASRCTCIAVQKVPDGISQAIRDNGKSIIPIYPLKFEGVFFLRSQIVTSKIPGVLGGVPLGERVAEATACRSWSEGETSPTKQKSFYIENGIQTLEKSVYI